MKAVERMEDFNGRGTLVHDMGLGKSFAAYLYALRNVTGPIVVVCPAVVKIGWAREAEKHLGRMAEVLYGRTPYPLTRRRNAIYVVNYDILFTSGRSVRSWADELKQLRPVLIVLDEYQRIRSHTAKRSKACKQLCEWVPKVLGLSGTPIEKRPMDLWFPLSIINPTLFPSRWSFGLHFCAGYKDTYGWNYEGASNTEELNRILLDSVMDRRRREDVLKDLPTKTRTVLPIELCPKDTREYNWAVADFLAWLRDKSKEKALRALSGEAMLRIGYLKRLAAELKLPLVIDWLRDFLDSDRKLLLFGVHNRILRDGIYPVFRRQSVLVNGEITGTKRQAAIDRFNNDPDCRIMVGNILAAGVGWSCTSADAVAFAELDWLPSSHLQAEERCRGIGRGTGRPVDSYWLVASGTIEESLCSRLQKRADVIARVVDGKDIGDLPVFNYLVEELKRQGKTTTKRRR